MGQPKEKPTVEQVLKLVEELTAEEREQVQQALNVRAIRERLIQAEESIARGEGIPAEVVLAELKERAEARLRKSQS
ncbi:MAG: hypothetical protein DA330_09075 [Nitrososphaera sp.]|nr:hypothetical protein [Nitrososphaera sp.]